MQCSRGCSFITTRPKPHTTELASESRVVPGAPATTHAPRVTSHNRGGTGSVRRASACTSSTSGARSDPPSQTRLLGGLRARAAADTRSCSQPFERGGERVPSACSPATSQRPDRAAARALPARAPSGGRPARAPARVRAAAVAPSPVKGIREDRAPLRVPRDTSRAARTAPPRRRVSPVDREPEAIELADRAQ